MKISGKNINFKATLKASDFSCESKHLVKCLTATSVLVQVNWSELVGDRRAYFLTPASFVHMLCVLTEVTSGSPCQTVLEDRHDSSLSGLEYQTYIQ